MISGLEISDVLGIDDKDYSINFGLYFRAEWFEPRLNLSTELWEEENVATETDVVPGDASATDLKLHDLQSFWNFVWIQEQFQYKEVIKKKKLRTILHNWTVFFCCEF